MPTNRTLRSWTLVVVFSGIASLVLTLLHLPSPVLFGALLGGMVQALTSSAPAEMPPWLFRLGQAIIGVTIGALVDVDTLDRLRTDWASVLAVTVGTLVISLAAGRLLSIRRDVSPATGAFSLIAGGASGVVAMAHDLGADDRVVTIVQYLRVLLVLLTVPVLASVFFHPATGLGRLAVAETRWLPDLVFVGVAVGAGMLASRFVSAPAMVLLGAMAVAVLVSASGVLGTVTVPAPVANVGYALVGIRVGLRFTRQSLRSIARLLPVTVLLIVLVVLACAGMGAALAAITGVDQLTAYLATTPGGLFAVLAIAADSGADVTYVLAVQVIRLFVVLMVTPLIGRALRRRGA
jgi:uncharacterized protein